MSYSIFQIPFAHLKSLIFFSFMDLGMIFFTNHNKNISFSL